MAAQTAARLSLGDGNRGRRAFRLPGSTVFPRGAARVALLAGVGVTALSFAALLMVWRLGARPEPAPATPAAVAASQGAPWPVPQPAIRSSELWYATSPAPGVWAELKVVLDNPLTSGPTRTTLFVSGTLMEDFRIRSTEPKLLTQPRRRPDGRYALVFAAPIPESLNWYRVFLECRNSAPRTVKLGFMLDGAKSLTEHPPVPAEVYFADRQADPFLVVPESIVRWVPGQAHTAFPVLVVYAVLLGAVAAAGCAAAFWAVRR
jgi:hypothetical protein